jgi:flagellar basal-body rod protein FlgF
MDKLLWTAMGGADQMLQAQAVASHNLANGSTTGYRADLHAFSSFLVQGPGFPTRIGVVNQSTGFDPRQGSFEQTGRPLDVAIQGEGWLAVQAPDGTEAYTRAGALHVSPEGTLETANGLAVLGDGGPISLPPATRIEIGSDGTISVVPEGLGPEAAAAVGRIKLVKPDAAQLSKGPDGLMRLPGGATAPADATVTVASGTLESSNVSIAESLVEMIQISREFELQVRLMRTAGDNDEAAQQLLRAA